MLTCSPSFVGAGPCRGCGEYVSAVPQDPTKRLHLVETPDGLAIYCPKCCPVCSKELKQNDLKTIQTKRT